MKWMRQVIMKEERRARMRQRRRYRLKKNSENGVMEMMRGKN